MAHVQKDVPNLVNRWVMEGHLAMDHGKVTAARAAYKKALDLDSSNFDAAFGIATTYAIQENLKMATNFFRRAVDIDPGVAEAHFNLGYALQLQKMLQESRDAYLKAVAIRPNYHVAQHNLGVVYEDLGDFDMAIEKFDCALSLQPDAAESHYNRGSVLTKLLRWDEALVSLNEAIRLSPVHVKALTNRGLVHFEQRNYAKALEDFSNAVILDPEDGDLYYRKGKAAAHMKQHPIAVDALRMAVKLKPDNLDAIRTLAFECEFIKAYPESLACFERLRKLAPDTPFINGYIFSSCLHECDWRSYDDNLALLLSGIAEGKCASQPHSALHLPYSRDEVRKASEIWVATNFGNIKPAPFNERKLGEKIRIGYFSADYHTHPVAMLITRLFELHDRSRFEVFAFSMGTASKDPYRLRIEKAVDHFINIREMKDEEIVALARDEGIDIAVDLTGYTAHNRASAFAMRLAPVQINYLGFSGTMGAPFIDYIVGDRVLIPHDHEPGYWEKVIRLPGSYMPTDPTRVISTKPMTRADYGLPDDKFVFCGFNNVTKLNPLVYNVWMRIMNAVPDSVLWLSPATKRASDHLRNEARKRGVSPERIIFANREDLIEDHLARQGLADLFLDSFPHNAHATACDALWAGLPVLTKAGEAYAARVAASLVTAVGMPEMVVTSDDEFLARAVAIATTPGESARLKARLAEQKPVTPLFDTQTYARKLETAYEKIVERQRAGLEPVGIDID